MEVSVKLSYEIFYIELWHILSLILILGVNYYITLKARKTPLLFSYLLAQSMLLLWIISKIFKTVSPTIEMRWFFIVTQYFGSSFLGGALFLFAYIYSKKRLPSKKIMIVCFLPNLLSFILVATNPLHYGFYSRFTFYGDDFGPLFYLTMAITYTYLILTILMLSRGFFKMFGEVKTRAYLFLISIVIPLMINVFYVLDLFELIFDYHPLFDYTPIATNFSLIFFALAAFKYRFLDILPMAQTQVFHSITNGVIISDHKGRIIDFNKSSSSIFPNMVIGDFLPTELNFENEVICVGDHYYKEIYAKKKKHIILRLIDITSVEHMVKTLTSMNFELSMMKERLEQLLEKKRQLAEIKTRNYILQELHDILGHAIVLAISASEVDILSGVKNYSDTLIKVKDLLCEGKNEFAKIRTITKETSEHTSLLFALETLSAGAEKSGLKVEIIVQETIYELQKECSEAAYRMCKEAITNAIKHGKAKVLSIILRFNDKELEIFVIDNGLGCKKIAFGKGLSGMINRISELDGVIEFSSNRDSGFQIHARIPRR